MNELVDMALGEKDYAKHNFLQWYVSEQIKEEKSARVLNDKLELIGDDKSGLHLFDRDIIMTRQKGGKKINFYHGETECPSPCSPALTRRNKSWLKNYLIIVFAA